MKETGAGVEGIKVAYGPRERARICPLDARRFGLYRQRRSVRPGCPLASPHDQSADQLRAGICVDLFRSSTAKTTPAPLKRRKRSDTAARIVAARLRSGAGAAAEVYRMRGFAVKRFPNGKPSEMPKDEIAKLDASA